MPDLRLMILLYFVCELLVAGVSKTVNKETGLLGWKLTQGSLQLELIQRLPDQTRAFLLGRGFPHDISDKLAHSCVFQTILRNTDKIDNIHSSALTVSLKDWQINQAGVIQSLKLKESWDQSWADNIVSPAARLAFRWATFPTTQTFQAGDYNWGMIIFGPPPGTQFDLQIIWTEDDKKYSAEIKKLSCAEDR